MKNSARRDVKKESSQHEDAPQNMPSHGLTKHSKRNAARAMLWLAFAALFFLSIGYIDAVLQAESQLTFQMKTPLSHPRQLVGYIGAFLLFLVPMGRNIALLYSLKGTLRQWALASIALWIGLLLWRTFSLFF